MCEVWEDNETKRKGKITQVEMVDCFRSQDVE